MCFGPDLFSIDDGDNDHAIAERQRTECNRKGHETAVFGKEVAKASYPRPALHRRSQRWTAAQAARLGVTEATIHDAIARGIYAHQIERIGSALVLRMEMAERSTHMRTPPSQLRFNRRPR